MAISLSVARALVMVPAALVLSAVGCGAQPDGETHPLRFAEERWVRIEGGLPALHADVSVDTAGISEIDGYRVAWVRQRLKRAMTIGRTADVIIERHKIDCRNREWGVLELVLGLQGAEVARESEGLVMLEADFTPLNRNVVDLVCAASL